MKETLRNFKALLVSLLTFFALLLGLKWHFIVVAILAVGVYVGVYLISKPKIMIGNTDIEALENGQEINQIFNDFEDDIGKLKALNADISDKEISGKIGKLIKTCLDIRFYLEKNPREISRSRYFLDYYVKTASEIVKNYSDLEKSNVSLDKFNEIKDKSNQSLDLLNEIFAKQRDSYHKDKINQLEVETDLLEQTIKLGGEIK